MDFQKYYEKNKPFIEKIKQEARQKKLEKKRLKAQQKSKQVYQKLKASGFFSLEVRKERALQAKRWRERNKDKVKAYCERKKTST